ncbi:hypothetical protein K493DRAFT_296663 [Basidiobolus meristosporus CBS 931.73]|uniref:F-box domain-containing protein n=1 Tax=Basidiobolus meristosporus CBS 931.73 TaxID=1314790 RepID=A0A1Y1Z4C3_9FUNG|nr:hypothetical protein K493DRAFT_296663 [Basidiobolus meristosporus CBS 931.73]|eukprot:ORY05132.1 hypothetical protein K493DRAFT_296663 [Basidiobolus meristosporus CBS 931.73]
MDHLPDDVLITILEYLEYPPLYASINKRLMRLGTCHNVIINALYNLIGKEDLWKVAYHYPHLLTLDIYHGLLGRGAVPNVWFFQVYVHEIVLMLTKLQELPKSIATSDITGILEDGLRRFPPNRYHSDCIYGQEYSQLISCQLQGAGQVKQLITSYGILPTVDSLKLYYRDVSHDEISTSLYVGYYFLSLLFPPTKIGLSMLLHNVYIREADQDILTYLLKLNPDRDSTRRVTDKLHFLQEQGLCRIPSDKTLRNLLVHYGTNDGITTMLDLIQQEWPELMTAGFAEHVQMAFAMLMHRKIGPWNDSSIQSLLAFIPEPIEFL